MGKYREIGERIVAAASPRFKDFRVDFEKISNAASKAAREGREGLAFDDAMAMFTDGDWDLRIPLQHRYAAEDALDRVAHYHAKRFKLYVGRDEPWPDEPAADALELFARHGRADLGVDLIRTYVDMQHKRLRRDYSARNPRKPRIERPEGVQQAIDGITDMIASAIPDRKAELLKDIETILFYVGEHGGREDRAWLEQVRREIWMERRA
jgi:hypothetical protein